jgi:hypothetical protein
MPYRLYCKECFDAGVPKTACGYSLSRDINGKNHYQLLTKYHKYHPNVGKVKTTVPEWLVNSAIRLLENHLVMSAPMFDRILEYSFLGENLQSQSQIEALVHERLDCTLDESRLRAIDRRIVEVINSLEKHKSKKRSLELPGVDALVSSTGISFYVGKDERFCFVMNLPSRATIKNCRNLFLVDFMTGEELAFEVLE